MIQVKCFEESHETDLEDEMNQFLLQLEDDQVMDIKMSCSHFCFDDEQIFSFSACIVYRIKEEKMDKLSLRRKQK
ncbi:MAG: sporulation protein Cse60 [Erysipelotrichaceae bacterium]|nr:sporulation protein Cse60 [Erysipelotrichaceae bacterium]